MRSTCQTSLHLAICAGHQMTSPAREQNHSTSMVNAELSQTCGHEKPILGCINPRICACAWKPAGHKSPVLSASCAEPVQHVCHILCPLHKHAFADVLCCVDELVVGPRSWASPVKVSHMRVMSNYGEHHAVLHCRFKWDGNVLHYLADHWSKVH